MDLRLEASYFNFTEILGGGALSMASGKTLIDSLLSVDSQIGSTSTESSTLQETEEST